MSAPTRLIGLDDAEALARIVRESREFLAPWEPVHEELYFTAEGQREYIAAALERYRQGTSVPYVIIGQQSIVGDPGQVVGRITLNNIVRGPFESCSVGYWVGASHGGHGYATAAVGEIKRVAFSELGLHRVEAGTLKHNLRSQRVLANNGFTQFGMAPNYLKIAGEWQDHVLFQVLNPDTPLA
jgi:ribosomal-protein-alanine N-acetyltransferase